MLHEIIDHEKRLGKAQTSSEPSSPPEETPKQPAHKKKKEDAGVPPAPKKDASKKISDEDKALSDVADEVAKEVLPRARGALKKKLQAEAEPTTKGKCRTAASPSHGLVKLILAAEKSYVVKKKKDKWPLLIEVVAKNYENHWYLAQLLFELIISR